VIIGSHELAMRYERALRLLGHTAQVADGEPAAHGLFAIAQRAGLLARAASNHPKHAHPS
jgi:hypothetical protein